MSCIDTWWRPDPWQDPMYCSESRGQHGLGSVDRILVNIYERQYDICAICVKPFKYYYTCWQLDTTLSVLFFTPWKSKPNNSTNKIILCRTYNNIIITTGSVCPNQPHLVDIQILQPACFSWHLSKTNHFIVLGNSL